MVPKHSQGAEGLGKVKLLVLKDSKYVCCVLQVFKLEISYAEPQGHKET